MSTIKWVSPRPVGSHTGKEYCPGRPHVCVAWQATVDGSPCAGLSVQYSNMSESRAAEVAEIMARHADKIAAEVAALDSLPPNATIHAAQ